VPGATTARWLGQLFLEPRPVELGAGSGFDDEILLRVEYARGERAATPAGALSGRAARSAPAGRALRSLTVEVRGRLRQVTVVESGDRVALDLFAGARRLARVPVLEANPDGRLLNLSAMGLAQSVVRWRNPGGRTFTREYGLGAWTLTPRG
jgi:hypothetical protein